MEKQGKEKNTGKKEVRDVMSENEEVRSRRAECEVQEVLQCTPAMLPVCHIRVSRKYSTIIYIRSSGFSS